MNQLSLMQFSQETILTDYGPVTVRPAEPPPAPSITFPLTVIWPGNTPAGVVEGQWQRLADGRIKATYNNYDEFYWAVLPAYWSRGKDL